MHTSRLVATGFERFARVPRPDIRETGEEVAGAFDLAAGECGEAVVERRIERRDGVSDADFEVHLRFRDAFDRTETDRDA